MPTEAPLTERANVLIPAVSAASCSRIAVVSTDVAWLDCLLSAAR